LDTRIIRQIPLFSSLTESEIRTFLEVSEEYYCQPGKVLLMEGFQNDYFYILLKGEIEIIKSFGTPDERFLRISREGSLLGEMGKFSQDGTHTATCRSLTDCRLLQVPFSWLNTTFSRHPEMMFDLMRLYCSRLENSENLTIKDLHEKNQQLTQAYNDLKIAQAAMIEKEKLDQEMRMAAKMQRSILPKDLPSFPGLDFGALMVPAKQVGGDFYDFILLDNHRVGIVIGDVCDKGIPSALLMALTYSSVRMEAFRHDKPGDTLRMVNQHLIEIDCSDMFVTLLFGILNFKNGEFEYARAGHPQALLLDENYQTIPIPVEYGQAIGIFESLEVDEGIITIPKNGTLLLYSDGLSETIEEIQSSPGLPETCSAVLNNEDLNAQACCEHLWKLVGGSGAESNIKDDFTVVLVRSHVLED
jgi:serine phosphatase RsbU (regulator of sigma subunit)